MYAKKKTINNCTSIEFNLYEYIIYIDMTFMIIKLNKYKKQVNINTPYYLNQNLCYGYFPKDTYLRHITIYSIKTLAHI